MSDNKNKTFEHIDDKLFTLRYRPDDSSHLNPTPADCNKCKDKPCTTDTVRLFLNETADDNIFNLVDAIVAKKPEKVYAMIREQYDQGQDAHYIFAMLVRQFRIMLELKDALTSTPATPPDVLAKTLGIHPFVVKKTIPLLRAYTLIELKAVYAELLSMDIKTKTGKGSLPVMIDMLVGKICVK